MKAKNKLLYLIISFLFLIPFRLPVSVLLINLFNFIAQIEGTVIPKDILQANVTITKLVYNLALSSLLVYNLETYSRQVKDRMARAADVYWWSFLAGILSLAYLAFDAYWTVKLFEVIT